MARTPKQQTLSKEEFKEAPGWLERLLEPINALIEAFNLSLNRGLTFQENMRAAIKTVTIATAATYTSGDFEPLRFSHGLTARPFMCLIAQIQKKAGNYEPIFEPVTVSWRVDAGQIVVDFITGLDDSSTYDVTFLVV